ncbi:MAG: flagellar hook-length control protein FliK [Spirochaetales bacterium]|nr:flagellar hook-length control protein FliK [Spirochaetales bacterium]
MVQLSNPTVDMIPVQKGPSPEKNSPSGLKDNGFRKALAEQKEIRDSQNTEARSTETSNEPAPEQVNRQEQKASDAENPSNQDVQNGESSSASEKKSEQTEDGTLAQKLVKGKQTGESLKLKSAGKIASDHKSTAAAGQDTPVLSESLTQNSQITVSPGDEIKADQFLQTAEEGISTEETIREAGVREILTGLTSGKTPADSGSFQISEKALTADSDKEKGRAAVKVSDKAARSSSDLKITVEDRRTPLEGAPLLQEVESEGSSNKLTLELVPSEEITGVMPSGEQGDTGRSFSLMTAEEQKGAALLDRQLQDKGTQELTKNIRFVLKDNKEGEIKLILKPEALGKVRINLNLNENNIVGKIIVENNSVRQAFMNNLADLTKALEDSGFSSASLDVSVGGGQAETGGQYREERPVYFTSNALDDMDGQIPVIYEDNVGISQINLVV